MAAIYRINYKSDFILTLHSDAGWATPFCLKFWTGAPSKAYFAGYDGEHYTHCAPDAEDPLKLVVQFDDHHLPVGDLKFQVSYHFAVADFPHDTEDEVLNTANITTEIDGEQAQVMLDFSGETAPEIEFALPAYAAEAQRIANEQQRIRNEETRIDNEQTRINQESARVNEYAGLKADAIAATGAANDAATLATQKAGLADDAATLATQKAGLAGDAATLATQKAGLADDASTLATQKAQYAQDEGDYAKAQGDYAKSQADLIPADVMRTASDAAFVNANREALFYMRQADEHLAGLMTSAEHNKLAALPTAADLETGIIYDVSALHPTSGVNGGSTYASLSAALAVIPQAKRKGGMSVKYVQSSDNHYIQYFCKTQTFTTNVADWEKTNLEEEVSQLGQKVDENCTVDAKRCIVDSEQYIPFNIANGETIIVRVIKAAGASTAVYARTNIGVSSGQVQLRSLQYADEVEVTVSNNYKYLYFYGANLSNGAIVDIIRKGKLWQNVKDNMDLTRYQNPSYPCFVANSADHKDSGKVSYQIYGQSAVQGLASWAYRAFRSLHLTGFDKTKKYCLTLFNVGYGATPKYQIRFKELVNGSLSNEIIFDFNATGVVAGGINRMQAISGDYGIDALMDFSCVPLNSSANLGISTNFIVAPECFEPTELEERVTALETTVASIEDNIVDLITDLPVSDGSDIEVGYAYINSTDGVVKVKMS